MEAQANLIEVFSSVQGEGPYVGEPMVFVRFQDCALSCVFCDTPDSFRQHSHFRLESPPESMKFTRVPNPVSGMELTKTLESFFPKTLSITGGEPLQHNDFLREWLPMVHPDYRILLETNGVLVEELRQVMDQVDIISMDMKLPSVTGMKDYWEEHEKFLKLAIAKEVYVKVVISSPTEEADLKKALAIVERYSPEIPFILQPATPFGPVRESVGPDRLRDFYKLSKSYLKNVRVIPQVHKQLGLL